jgi:hypothetical protein
MEAAMSWQIRFDGGHQQRYLPDRDGVLRYVLSIAPRAAGKQFEVFAEAEPVLLADGTSGGRRFVLTEVIDFDRPGEADRLRAELGEATGQPGAAASQPGAHRERSGTEHGPGARQQPSRDHGPGARQQPSRDHGPGARQQPRRDHGPGAGQ